MHSKQSSFDVAARLLSWLCQACMMLAVGCLTLMAVLVVLQVVARNGFDLGLPWADELARFGGLSLVFLSIPLLALRGQHVAVDLVPQLMGGRTKLAMAVATEIGILIFCVISLYGMYSYLSRAGKFATPAIGMSNWFFYAPATIGLTLIACVAVLRLTQFVMTATPETPIDGQS